VDVAQPVAAKVALWQCMLCKGLLQGLMARFTACHWLQNVTTLSCYMGDSYPYPYACTHTRIHIRIHCTHIRIHTHRFLYPWENPCLTDTRIWISHGFTPGYNVCIRGLPLPLPILDRLDTNGISTPENLRVMMVLGGLPNDWDQIASTMLHTIDASKLTMAEIMPKLQQEWNRCSVRNGGNQQQALVARSNIKRAGKKPEWQNQGPNNQFRPQNNYNNQGQNFAQGQNRPNQKPFQN
jgi:hypothetical protein